MAYGQWRRATRMATRNGAMNTILIFEQSLQNFVAEAKKCTELHLNMIREVEMKYRCLDEESQIHLKNGVSNPKSDDVIKLNVSGWKMQYLRGVFLSATGSLLAAMFSGKWDQVLPKDRKGRFFIDENPILFDYILKKLANIPVSRQFEDSELKLLDSIYERYKIPKFWGKEKGDVQPTPKYAEVALLSSHAASLKKPFLNLLDCIEDVRAVSKMLAEEYEQDVLFLEDEITFVEKLIKDRVLELNVRGECIITSKSTLQVYPDSMLATKFDETEWTFQKDKDLDEYGNIRLDVDPSVFRGVLDHLRWKKFHPGKTCPEISNQQEKETIKMTLAYLFPGIEYSMFFNAFDESQLSNDDAQQLLLSWCNKSLRHHFSKGQLLYRASRDGWASTDFHSKCDGKAPTVIVISANGAVFGGFSDVPWKSSGQCEWEYSSHAFIFSLVPPSSVTTHRNPTMFVLREGCHDKAINQFNNSGLPIFGEDDLYIHTNANASTLSSSHLGRTYISSEVGRISSLSEDLFPSTTNYLAGSRNFRVNEIECFAIG